MITFFIILATLAIPVLLIIFIGKEVVKLLDGTYI